MEHSSMEKWSRGDQFSQKTVPGTNFQGPFFQGHVKLGSLRVAWPCRAINSRVSLVNLAQAEIVNVLIALYIASCI